MSTAVHGFSPKVQWIQRAAKTRALFRGYTALKLPLAAMAGLRVAELTGTRCTVTVPYSWRSQNPFGSIYFAALSMAAELSCAGLALSAARGASQAVSVLPVGMNASFDKKATALTTFVCEDGDALFEAVNQTLQTGESITVATKSSGRMNDGTVVARFGFEWSFKRK